MSTTLESPGIQDVSQDFNQPTYLVPANSYDRMLQDCREVLLGRGLKISCRVIKHVDREADGFGGTTPYVIRFSFLYEGEESKVNKCAVASLNMLLDPYMPPNTGKRLLQVYPHVIGVRVYELESHLGCGAFWYTIEPKGEQHDPIGIHQVEASNSP